MLPVVIDRFWRSDARCAEFDSAGDGRRVVVPDASTVAAHRNDNAHAAYQQQLLQCERTIATTLFGLSRPARRRVVPNEATRRWCHPDGTARRLPSILNAKSSVLARLGPEDADDRAILRLQRPSLPVFTQQRQPRMCPITGLNAQRSTAATRPCGRMRWSARPKRRAC